MDKQEYVSWIRTAPADDVVHVGTQALARIATLPDAQKDQFISQLKDNPTTAKLLTDFSG